MLGTRADGTPVLRLEAGCGGCPVRCGGAADAAPVAATLGLGGAASGARVALEVRARGLTRIALVLFGLPLTGLFAGAVAGAAAGGDTLSAVSGCAGLAMGYALARECSVRQGAAWLDMLAPRARMLATATDLADAIRTDPAVQVPRTAAARLPVAGLPMAGGRPADGKKRR